MILEILTDCWTIENGLDAQSRQLRAVTDTGALQNQRRAHRPRSENNVFGTDLRAAPRVSCQITPVTSLPSSTVRRSISAPVTTFRSLAPRGSIKKSDLAL